MFLTRTQLDVTGASWDAGDDGEDSYDENSEKIDLTVHDAATKELLATINQMRIDLQVSDLLRTICRQAGLPISPVLLWQGSTLSAWHSLREVGLIDKAEVAAMPQQALVTASHDGFAKIWNMDTGECETTLQGHEGKVLSSTFSPNGRWVVTASEDKTARLWSTLYAKCERIFQHADAVNSASFSPDGKLIATASEDCTAKVWVLKTGLCRATLVGHSLPVYSAVFNAESSEVRTESRDGTVKLWNSKTGVCDRTLVEQHSVYATSYSPDGEHMATTPGDCTASILNVKTGECDLTLIGHDDLVISVAYCPQRPTPA